jgi:hypothetical protein
VWKLTGWTVHDWHKAAPAHSNASPEARGCKGGQIVGRDSQLWANSEQMMMLFKPCVISNEIDAKRQQTGPCQVRQSGGNEHNSTN